MQIQMIDTINNIYPDIEGAIVQSSRKQTATLTRETKRKVTPKKNKHIMAMRRIELENILASHEGVELTNSELGDMVNVSKTTAGRWKGEYYNV